MAKPVTENFHEMVVEIETTPGVFSKICGLTSNALNRAHNMSTSEVPGDCDDESVPAEVERAVQSSEVTLSGTGSWPPSLTGS